MFSALTGWLLYFTPTLVTWYRVSNGLPAVFPVKQMALFNLLVAWTVIGWFLLLANALGFNPVARVAPKLADYLIRSGLAGTPPPQQGGQPSGSTGQGSCGQCGGSGTLTCTQCQGRGTWYDAPQTASGSPELRHCGACTSSGRLRCTYCGGSGRVNY